MVDKRILRALQGPQEQWHVFVSEIAKERNNEPLDLTGTDLRGVTLANLTYDLPMVFDRCTFENLSFVGCTIKAAMSFRGATFHGQTTIGPANATKGAIHFDGATFEGFVHLLSFANSPVISFVECTFKDGFFAQGQSKDNQLQARYVDFRKSIVDGDLVFEACAARKAMFCGARFQSRQVESLRQHRSSFINSTFDFGADFSDAEFFRAISFENVKFLGSSSFRGSKFHVAPNFHDAQLHQGTMFSPQHKFPALFPDLTSDGAVEAYRTLKLAMNKQHALSEELGFFLLEMRATAQRQKRWWRVPYFLYDWLSMYGQSVKLPLLWFLAAHMGFGLAYSKLAGTGWGAWQAKLLSLTLHGAIPFAAALRWDEVTGGPPTQIFPKDALPLVQLLVAMQGIVSVILLFLIGLGLRNMFKIR